MNHSDFKFENDRRKFKGENDKQLKRIPLITITNFSFYCEFS